MEMKNGDRCKEILEQIEGAHTQDFQKVELGSRVENKRGNILYSNVELQKTKTEPYNVCMSNYELS